MLFNLLYFIKGHTVLSGNILFHYLIVHDGFETLDNFMLVPFVNLLLPRDTRQYWDEANNKQYIVMYRYKHWAKHRLRKKKKKITKIQW